MNSGEDMGKIYFNLEEARQIIPIVTASLQHLRELKEEIEVIQTVRLQAPEYSMEYELMALDVNKKYHQLSVEFFEELKKLTEKGCIIKDIKAGLVDFYSKFKERDIFLCWKYGEETVQFWHEVKTGSSQRQNVQLLEQEYEKELQKLK